MSHVYNPLTGRQIQYGGATHTKLVRCLDTIDQVLAEHATQRNRQSGGAKDANKPKSKGKQSKQLKQASDDFYEELLKKSNTYSGEPKPIHPKANDENILIPESKYHLISSALPPNPNQHSWYHHHAPFSQNFGAYVCLKRETLEELGTFLRDSLFTGVKT